MTLIRLPGDQLWQVVIVRERDGEATGLEDRRRVQVVSRLRLLVIAARHLDRELTIAAI